MVGAETHIREAEGLLRAGEALLAYEVCQRALGDCPGDVRLRQLLALALTRAGAAAQARDLLEALRGEGRRDKETLGLLAGTYKDLWETAGSGEKAREYLNRCMEAYAEAYRVSGGYWPGINAATMRLLSGDAREARELARRVEEQCLRALGNAGVSSGEAYWPRAALGEACLIQGKCGDAARWYAEAVHEGGGLGDWASTRRSMRAILKPLGMPADTADRWLPMPSVVVFTGHMLDAPDRACARFPASMEERVREALRVRLEKVHAGIGYAAAACGADILFQEEMLRRGGRINIVLPHDVDVFRENSVARAGGPAWAARFEALLSQADDVVIASETQCAEAPGASYEYGNAMQEGLAILHARQLDAPLVRMAVWDGARAGALGGAARCVARWMREGAPFEWLRLPDPDEQAEAADPFDPAAMETSGDDDSSIMAILFAAGVGFGQVSEPGIHQFVQEDLPRIGHLAKSSANRPDCTTTWGDGLCFLFKDLRAAGLFALELCELRSSEKPETHIPIRITLHAGPAHVRQDPVTGHTTAFGRHVNRAARIEPITPPGHVYASQAFAALAAVRHIDDFRFIFAGRAALAQNTRPERLWRLARRHP